MRITFKPGCPYYERLPKETVTAELKVCPYKSSSYYGQLMAYVQGNDHNLYGFTPHELIANNWATVDTHDGDLCLHDFKTYVGLTESYTYCTKCDAKSN